MKTSQLILCSLLLVAMMGAPGVNAQTLVTSSLTTASTALVAGSCPPGATSVQGMCQDCIDNAHELCMDHCAALIPFDPNSWQWSSLYDYCENTVCPFAVAVGICVGIVPSK